MMPPLQAAAMKKHRQEAAENRGNIAGAIFDRV